MNRNKIFFLKWLGVCMVLLLLGTGCSQEHEISGVAKNYLKALVDYRLEEAKKFGDESAVQFLDAQLQIINGWTPEQRESARKELENTEVKISGVEIKDQEAVVKYEYVKNGRILQAERLYLVKKPAGWRVKETIN